jgi:3-mercaptopyruvate sulfurtransferase SseA
MLQRKLDDCEKVGVIDLLSYEAMNRGSAGIPGAVRVDPQRLREDQRVVVPHGVSIVLYCSSKSEFTSARVAQALSRIGITDVWILEGGLDAWVAEGRPTTVTLSTREELAMRLGIVLPKVGPEPRSGWNT